MTKLDGKVVLITGAARGIGAETARALAQRGARLVLVDLDAEPLAALAAELGADRVVTVVCDVCDLASVEDGVTQGVTRFGGIDVVLANAGIASYGSVLAVDPGTFKRVMDINVLGVFHTVRAALPSVIERRGYVLIVSSVAAFAPAPGLAAYNASKAAVEHFANALRLEVAHQGVDIGSAHMAWIDTPLTRDAKGDVPALGEMIATLPGPLAKTTAVDTCASAFMKGIENRSRRVNVPGWVGPLGWFKAIITSKTGEGAALKHVPRLLPKMDAEVAALGRSTSARNTALEDVAVVPD